MPGIVPKREAPTNNDVERGENGGRITVFLASELPPNFFDSRAVNNPELRGLRRNINRYRTNDLSPESPGEPTSEEPEETEETEETEENEETTQARREEEDKEKVDNNYQDAQETEEARRAREIAEDRKYYLNRFFR